MTRGARPPVVAIGIDAAEPRLVRDLIDRGQLPTLAALLERGHFAHVDSRGDIGSGAVWPTFTTASDPVVHQKYSGWAWHPESMRVSVPDLEAIAPFWRSALDAGRSVAILDVPFPPLGGGHPTIEVDQWGPHDKTDSVLRGVPEWAVGLARGRPHPFHELLYGPGFAADAPGRQALFDACREGVRLRGALAAELIAEAQPDLSIIVFTELHHAAHQLWNTVETDVEMYRERGVEFGPGLEPNLADLLREIDAQVARLLDAAGDDAIVLTFSLHGMKAGVGIPDIHIELLERLGLSARASRSGMPLRDRATSLFEAAKRRSPQALRRLYYRTTSYEIRRRLAEPTVVPPHDWSRTRVFSLPTDQRGYMRVNLAGREAKGIVPRGDYQAVCEELEAVIWETRRGDGAPLVAEVIRTAPDGPPPKGLPDVIVSWRDEAFADPTEVVCGTTRFEARPIRPDMTGQHQRHGFATIDDRLLDGTPDEVVHSRELARGLLAGLGVSSRAAS